MCYTSNLIEPKAHNTIHVNIKKEKEKEKKKKRQFQLTFGSVIVFLSNSTILIFKNIYL